MKKLCRVSVEGEVWVMAEGHVEAERLSRKAVSLNSHQVDHYVYPMLPVRPSMVDDGVLETIPYNADPGDTRTVGDHIQAAVAAREAAKTPIKGSPAVKE